MPGAAPDDPAAYRGVRYQMDYPVGQFGGGAVNGVQGAPWLRGYSASGGPAGGVNGPWFGWQVMRDGRRLMVWFFRFVEPPTMPPPDSPAGSDPSPSRWAVLDVVALPGEPEGGLGIGCGPDSVIMDGDNAWRLNRTTGRMEPVDPDDFVCDEPG